MPAMTSASRSEAPIALQRAAERKLVRQAARGDRTAARAFIRRFQRPVAAVLRRMLRPSGLDHLTEDLAQETFVRAFAALPRFDVDGPAKVSTWIVTIATRLALQQLQKRRLPTEALGDAAVPVAPAGTAADAQARRAALGRAIERAVADLAPPHRAAWVLREFHDLDYAEIAEALDIDIGTVKSRLSRARTALRTALAEERHD